MDDAIVGPLVDHNSIRSCCTGNRLVIKCLKRILKVVIVIDRIELWTDHGYCAFVNTVVSSMLMIMALFPRSRLLRKTVIILTLQLAQ